MTRARIDLAVWVALGLLGTVAVWVALGLLGTVATFTFAYRFMMHHFVSAPYLWDTGWFSYAIFRHGLILPNVPQLRGIGDSVFTQHVYGLAALLNPLSYAFDTHYHYFSAVMGGTYALTFFAPFLAVRAGRPGGRTGAAWAVVAFGVGLLFAHSGQVLVAMGYPHFEVAIPGFFILFVALHFLGFERGKWLALAAGLLVREDAGLHYFGYAAVLAVFQQLKGEQPFSRKTLVAMVAVPLVVSVSMMFIQRHWFWLGQSMFHRSYVGEPAFGHLNAVELGVRAERFWRDAGHIYIPALMVVAAAVVLRLPSLALGYLACVPWVAINVGLSLTPAAQTLSLYYAFPLLVGLAWPLFVPQLETASWRTLVPLPLAALAAWVSTDQLGLYAAPVEYAARDGGALSAEHFHRIERCLREELARSPRLYADPSVAAMFPEAVPAAQMRGVDAEEPDGFVFFTAGNGEAYTKRAAELGLEHYAVTPNLRVEVWSREPLGLDACFTRSP